MRISATGIDRLPAAVHAGRGFSLVELMIVMVIVALAAGTVVMALPRGAPDLGAEADAFAARLDRIARDSILSNRLIGIEIGPEGFQAFRLTRGRWEELDGDDASGAWSEGTLVRVGQGASRVAPDSSSGDEKDEDGPPEVNPQIRFDPVGMTTPFWMSLERGGLQIVLRGAADGTITVESDGAP